MKQNMNEIPLLWSGIPSEKLSLHKNAQPIWFKCWLAKVRQITKSVYHPERELDMPDLKK